MVLLVAMANRTTNFNLETDQLKASLKQSDGKISLSLEIGTDDLNKVFDVMDTEDGQQYLQVLRALYDEVKARKVRPVRAVTNIKDKKPKVEK